MPLRVSVQSLPDFFRRDLDVFVFVGQPIGPRFYGLVAQWGCVAVRRRVQGMGSAGGADRSEWAEKMRWGRAWVLNPGVWFDTTLRKTPGRLTTNGVAQAIRGGSSAGSGQA